MRRYYAILILSTAALALSACGGSSNTGVNSGRADDESTVNSERIESSNMAPTGGPGPEPESKGTQSSANTGESKNGNANADNKNKSDNKSDNKNKNTQ